MSLYENWVRKAYEKNGQSNKKVWDIYLPLEQKIYEDMLTTKKTHIHGTISELSRRYKMTTEQVCGFLDGVKEALVGESGINLESLEETTEIDIEVDFEQLYKKMVEYKAEHLYNLPEWNNIYTPEQRKELYISQKSSGTIVRDKAKIGRNDPCPCGSGKKYKKCCGFVVNSETKDSETTNSETTNSETAEATNSKITA